MSGFFEYEVSHNTFLHKVQDVPQFRDLFKFYCLSNEGVLLVPQSVTLEKLTINQAFVESHIIIQNPANRSQFVTVNGACGLFSANRETFYIISDPPVDNSLFNPLADPLTIFTKDSIFHTFDIAQCTNPVTVLREGHFTIKLEGKDTEIPLILISDPLVFAGVQPVTKIQPAKQESTGSSLYGLPLPSLSISIPNLTNLTSSIPSYIPSYLSSSPNKAAEAAKQSTPPQTHHQQQQQQTSNNNTQLLPNPITPTPAQKQGSFWNSMFGSSISAGDKPPLFPDSPTLSPPPDRSLTTHNAPPNPLNLPNPSNHSILRPPTAAQINNHSNMTASRSYDSLVTLNPPPTTPPAATPENTPSQSDIETQKRAQFLSKLKHPRAADLMKSLKTFIVQFRTSSPADVEDQAQVVRLCLGDMERDIEQHPLWKEGPPLNDEDLDIIREALEKHVTTKLYHCTFPPARTAWNNIKNTPAGRSAIDPSTIALNEMPTDKDLALTRLINSLQFITPKHLDIHPNLATDSKLNLARAELRKINNYKTPRDKMVCILNCCKVIFNLLNNFGASVKNGETKSMRPAGADEFLPLLIYVTLKANPPMLDSNTQYVQHFRHPSKMIGEAGYYFTNLLSVISFIQNISPERLSIDPAEFERLKVEHAEKEEEPVPAAPRTAPTTPRHERRPSTTPIPTTPTRITLTSSSNSATNLMDEPVPMPTTIRHDNSTTLGGGGSQGNSGSATPNIITTNGAPVDTDQLITELASTFTFMKYSADELKIGQIAQLLDDYKRIALENMQLKKLLAHNSIPSNLNNNVNTTPHHAPPGIAHDHSFIG